MVSIKFMKQLGYWIHAARPKTLPAAAVPVMVGGALAMAVGGFSLLPWILCLVFALLVQVGTNYANDYYDYLKGADGKERIGPKRAVASGWIAPQVMHRGMVITFVIAFIVGCSLIHYGGWPLLIVGVLSILCGVAYTGGPYPLGYNGLGDVFVFIFFGWVATGFTFYVQTGGFVVEFQSSTGSLFTWLAGMVPGALSTNLLVVNNVRDEKQDRKSGKRTLAVRFGKRFGIFQYDIHLVMAILVPLTIAVVGRQWSCLLVLLAAPLMVKSSQLLRRADSREEYQVVLEKTALILIVVGVLFSAGLVIDW